MGFQLKWNDKLDTALYALLVSRNMNHIFCWPAKHGILKEIPFGQSVLRNIFAEDNLDLQICLALEYLIYV